MAERFSFSIQATDGAARTGYIEMQRGDIRTPAFMPVGTAATVKAMKPETVRKTGADIILGRAQEKATFNVGYDSKLVQEESVSA